jgi:hypothetical protein
MKASRIQASNSSGCISAQAIGDDPFGVKAATAPCLLIHTGDIKGNSSDERLRPKDRFHAFYDAEAV